MISPLVFWLASIPGMFLLGAVLIHSLPDDEDR